MGLIRLVQVNAVDMNSAEMRDPFRKHGTTDLYEKVRRICTHE